MQLPSTPSLPLPSMSGPDEGPVPNGPGLTGQGGAQTATACAGVDGLGFCQESGVETLALAVKDCPWIPTPCPSVIESPGEGCR